MSITSTRYRNLLNEFDVLISAARAISDRLEGSRIDHKFLSYSDAIYNKLVCHGISLRRISPSLDTQTNELWDIASACAIARALIEAYDALAYIAVHEVTPLEREFRVLLWELHDQQRRLSMLEKIKSADPRVSDIRERVNELSEKLKSHEFYLSTSKELRGKVARREAPAVHISQKELNAASGINHEYYVAATMFLSQYVHTYPMSLNQLMNFRAGTPDALHMSSMPLQYSMPFLAKAIEGMVIVWPQVSFETNDEIDQVMQSWLMIAEQGVQYV